MPNLTDDNSFVCDECKQRLGWSRLAPGWMGWGVMVCNACQWWTRK